MWYPLTKYFQISDLKEEWEILYINFWKLLIKHSLLRHFTLPLSSDNNFRLQLWGWNYGFKDHRYVRGWSKTIRVIESFILVLSSAALMVIRSQESHQEPEQKAVGVQSACVAQLLQAAAIALQPRQCWSAIVQPGMQGRAMIQNFMAF